MVKQNGENLIMRRILSVLLENESGALSRVIGLFSQRGYNIESLTVAPTDDLGKVFAVCCDVCTLLELFALVGLALCGCHLGVSCMAPLPSE